MPVTANIAVLPEDGRRRIRRRLRRPATRAGTRGTAAEALDQLDEAYRLWSDGVEALGTDGLTLPAHPDEPAYDGWATASIVLHVQRELLHHGAEIALLRDLYRASGSE